MPKSSPKPKTATGFPATAASLGGRARAAAIKAGTADPDTLGGRKAIPETLVACRRILEALAVTKDAEEREFLRAAFRALAPSKVYQGQWTKACGPKLTEEDRRSYRGWGPERRDAASQRAAAILRDAKTTKK